MKTNNKIRYLSSIHLVIYLISALFILPSPTQAHQGGLDSFGCHHNRKGGAYECHKGQLEGRTFANKAEVKTLLGGQENQSFSGKVIGISDGDTIKVMRNEKVVKVRLSSIDCPEKRQAFGRKATRFTADMVAGEIVTVKVKDIDRYGRTVGEVILPNGRSLNRELVKAGLAWWYRKYSDDETLGALEQGARKKHLGLWSDEDPVPPWEFRRRK